MRSMSAALILFCAGSVQSQLLNPGFEPDTAVGSNNILPGGSTDVPGWTTILQGVEWFNAAQFSAASPDGGYAVDLCNFTYTTGGIQQSIATDIGTQYTVEFYLGTQKTSGRVGTAEIFVDAGDTPVSFEIATNTASAYWELRSFTFTATSPQTMLTFASYQDANAHFAYIDGINVIPAPASTALLGISALAATRRRR